MLKTVKTIILSRLTKPKIDKEVLRKREICKVCEFNSKNIEKIPLKKLIIKKLSDFYSWITGNSDEDNLGNCTFCQSCSIFYKTLYEDSCGDGLNKWDKNYENNNRYRK